LGIGGYGEVWRAEHYSMPYICAALKFCLAPESKKSLLHEGKLLNQVMKLDKPDGIVKLRNAFLDIENPCLEYDYINGGNLGAVINFQNNIESSKRHLKALQILKRLTQIMVPLHAMNPAIIHRDLKPTNILLSKTNGKFEIFIADFGIGAIISKINIDEENKEKDPTYSRASLLGTHTLHYCSPEQKNHALPHPADDIHALGIIGYQLIVGSIFKTPNHGFDVDLLESGVSPNFVTILKRCVDGKRERRYANAGELLNAINSLSAQKTLVVTEPIETVSKPKTPKPKESEKLEVYEEEEDKNIVEQLAAGYNNFIASLSSGAPQYFKTLQIIGFILCGLFVFMLLPVFVFTKLAKQSEMIEIEQNKKKAEKEQEITNVMKKVVGTWISQDGKISVEFSNNICSLKELSSNTGFSKTMSNKSVVDNAFNFNLYYERFVIDFDSQNNLLISNDISNRDNLGDNAVTKLLAGKFIRCSPDQIKNIMIQISSQNNKDKSNALAQEQEVSKIMQKVVGTWITANGNMTVQFTNNICAFSANSIYEVRSKNIIEKSVENNVLYLKLNDNNTFAIDFDTQNNLLISNNVSNQSPDVIKLLKGKFIKCTPEQIKYLSKKTTDNFGQKKYDGFNSFIEQPKAPAMLGEPPGR
jgi:serine/threonine protein kinase